MASNTENLNLLMKNPSTDGADTFNVDTMLNENWRKIDANAGSVAKTLANILKPTTPPLIGLPPSTTPDGMFRALGNTGELHVWRKTVVTGTAKVELEPAVSGYIVSNNGSSYKQTIKYSSTIDEKGNLSGTITTLTVSYNTSNSDLFVLKGKYFEAGTTEISSNLKSPGGVWYIPNDASIQYITGQPSTTGYPYYYTHVATKMQKVVYVPAGTTTTYPVSTNPNAYQEGSDAKPAGYVLGDVVTGNFSLTVKGNGSTTITWLYSSAVTVSDNGEISFVDSTSSTINAYDYASNAQKFKGKFCKTSFDGTDFAPNEVCFIPANASIVQSGDKLVVDRYQPVTGYAAITAGTTIEYLGKLGDKAKVQVVSYVGTGTYGSDHPNSLTFDFVPKIVIISKITADSAPWALFLPPILSGTYSRRAYNITGVTTNQTDSFAKINKKTLSWFSTNGFTPQLNSQSDKYTAIAIG